VDNFLNGVYTTFKIVTNLRHCLLYFLAYEAIVSRDRSECLSTKQILQYAFLSPSTQAIIFSNGVYTKWVLPGKEVRSFLWCLLEAFVKPTFLKTTL